MKRDTVFFIENIANRIATLSKFDKDLKIKKLLDFLCADIQYVPVQDMDCSVSTIQKTGDFSFTIFLNPEKDKVKEKFRIAHDIGHVILHLGYLASPELWNKQEKNKKIQLYKYEQEIQANAFALSVLMPYEKFLNELKKNSVNNIIDIQDIAKIFKVKPVIAKQRAMQIGCIEFSLN